MSRLKYIGGFFELELKDGGSIYHQNAIPLTNGRACLSLILKKIKPQKCFVPYYSCDALYQPVKKYCNFEFYTINNELEISDIPDLRDGEHLIYINYFGLKNLYVEKLKKRLGEKLIIDETHNFFNTGHNGFWSFTTARKYFGVPDGAYLYTPVEIEANFERNIEVTLDHLSNRLAGRQELAYQQFVSYEKELGTKIKSISVISEKLLSCVDFQKVRNDRKKNYNFYRDLLSDINVWSLEASDADPFCYPLMLDKELPKRSLYKNNIFIPILWPDVLERGDTNFEVEVEITRKLLPLPVDHRYTPHDLEEVIAQIKELIGE